ncbi:hypothetical protein Hdeb2414_s0003g00097881 [Helianthus debilis subsp. tardiflorus]
MWTNEATLGLYDIEWKSDYSRIVSEDSGLCDQVQGAGHRRLRSYGLMCVIVKFLAGSYI